MSTAEETGDDRADPARAPHEGEMRYATRDQLRAMAHPVRMQIVDRVGRRGTARAADIAEDLDLPANSVSYHLRTLARGGVIVEAPEAARDRRDRVWKLARTSFMHAPGADGEGDGDPEVTVDEEYVTASGATTMAALEWIRAGWVSEIAQRTANFPEAREQQPPAMLFSTPMRLSRAQARELFEAVEEKLLEYNRINRDAQGADLPGDPDSDGEAQDVRVLFSLLGERPHPASPVRRPGESS